MTDGIQVERRAVLRLPVVLGAGALLAGGRPGDDVSGAIAFEEFTRHWKDALAELDAEVLAADDVYLGRLLTALARLSTQDVPGLGRRNTEAPFTGGPVWAEGELVAIRFDMKPGAEIRPHDHPPQVVLTAGLAGECAFRHFESVAEKPDHASRDPFLVRETRRGYLGPRRSTTLTRTRDWIHTFRAGPEGASIVDMVWVHEDSNDWAYATLADEPVEAERGLYRATWEPR